MMASTGRHGGGAGRAVRLLAALLAAWGVASCGGAEGSEPTRQITVAAASDLRLAFEELGERFSADTGVEVAFSFGSSGQLREQVINGAPFEVFASADVDHVDAVIDAGRGLADTKTDYGYGRLVLWSRPGAPLPQSVADLADPAIRRIAIANPEHAPYGAAAVDALRAAGVDDEVDERLVYGENIADTLRLARSGNADVAVVALSLVLDDGGDHRLVPEELHRPLRQALVVTGTGEIDAARSFASYVNSPAGREVMVRYGFALPGEAVPGR